MASDPNYLDRAKAIRAEALAHKQASVSWFSPIGLWRTYAKVKDSETIASHADYREIQAGFANIYDWPGEASYHDFAQSGPDFAFDFAADTGDGWDATLAVADLMLRPSLQAGEHELKRPGAVIFGGDLVYPTASREEYKRRFIGPFNYAATTYPPLSFKEPEEAHDDKSPRIFAIPGNHDWYDGLTAFWSFFCRARLLPKETREAPPQEREKGLWVGPWLARQQRSYFALKLPHDWWIWGIDVQLSQWVDTPQRYYFEDLLKKMIADAKAGEKAKLIICTAEPSWVFGNKTPARFRALAYMTNLALQKGVEVRAILTGDLHHYSRFEGMLACPTKPESTATCKFITAGGGGAYSASTHDLPGNIPSITISEGIVPNHYAQLGNTELKKAYPDAGTSRGCWEVWCLPLLFGLRNPWFAVCMAALWATFRAVFSGPAASWGSVLLNAPTFLPGLLVCLPWVLLVAFARRGEQSAEWEQHCRWVLLGLSHLAIQLPAGILLGDFAWSYIEWWASPWLRMVASGVMGSLSTCFIMGLYLMICTKWLDLHHNEAFTALRLTNWKNFLRIQLSSGKMTVYAVGLDKIGDEPERNRPILIDEFEL